MEDIWKDNDFFNSYFINENDDSEEEYDRTNEIGIHDGGSSYFVFQNKLEKDQKLNIKFQIYSYNYEFKKQNASSFGCGFVNDKNIFDDYNNNSNELVLPNSMYFHSTSTDVCKLLHNLSFRGSNEDVFRKINKLGNKNYTYIYDEDCELSQFQNSTNEHVQIHYDTECEIQVDMSKRIAEVTFGSNIIYRFRIPDDETYLWFYLDSFKDVWCCFKMLSYEIN